MFTRPNTQSEQDDLIDLRAIGNRLWGGKWIIAICALFGLTIGLFLASQIVPQYRATAKLLLGTERADVLRNQGVMVEEYFGTTTLLTHIEILSSTKLINRVIDKLGIDQGPEDTEAAEPPSGFEEFLIRIGMRAPPPPPPSPEVAAERHRLALVTGISAGMTLDSTPDSRVISISFTSTDPQFSAAVANEVAEQYLVDQLEGKLETTQNAVDWLAVRVEELRIKVEDAERAVEDAYARLNTETGQSLEATQQQIQALNQNLIQVRQELTTQTAQLDRLQAAMDEGQDLATLTEFRDSRVIGDLRRRESDLVTELAAQASTVPENHPSLSRLPGRARKEAELAEVRKGILAEAGRIVRAFQVDLQAKREAEAQLSDEVRALEETAAEQSRDAIEIRQLEREALAAQTLYESLLSRLQESTEEVSLQAADARIITPAEVPMAPLGTSARRTKAMGLLVGLVVGVGIVLLLDRMNNTFRSPQQIEQLTGQNVLGMVPLAGKHLKRSDVISYLREKPNSSLTEAIRNLRTSILFSDVDHPPKKVMFTSSVPREGKSTTAIMLALTSQQMGKSAIIVDCDLRMPALSKALNVENDDLGLLSVINGSASLEQSIFVEPTTGLHILMTKPSERNLNVNASDVLASHRFEVLLDYLAKTYDIVILDAPPTLVVTDARILSSMADAVIYAIRWDSTPRDAVIEGLRELRTVDGKVTGTVLTMVNESKASKYAYDGYSYYRGKYRDYYETG
ncbi:MAG: polysaccharide biosynthesis tyrosine autokinase [Maritimibacter sp.]|nr:polysaccharide biosynthesis tyrosine autokinase [Maritimibacter sp.]